MIRLDFGDLHYLGESVLAAVRRRSPGIVRTAWWVIRQHHRRGTHQPFTFAQYRALRRRRRPQ
ncbi:MAG TPA: hypothetical protein VOB72_04205 [Candidatus Dormibacteraeota bacterium]|nr:hypothetical protein [Candidatus Dormibacteraeota bacterium]